MKHIQFLRNLRQLQFSGQLIRTDSTGQQWIFYLSQGSIVYATGGVHSVRRFLRNVTAHCPSKAAHRVRWYADLVNSHSAAFPMGWEYALLQQWVSCQEITPKQVARIVHSILVEMFFDIEQANRVSDRIKQDGSISAPLGSVRLEEVTAAAQTRWQSWQEATLTDYSPHKAPVIRQPEQLQRLSSGQTYQTLIQLLNGQHTLLDVAGQMRRDVVQVATSLLPFIQLGIIELTSISDLSAPVHQRKMPEARSTPARSALIACVDDSFLVRHTMDKLLTSAGYQFLGIDDAVRAIGILIARKPDLIFLDLVMPNTNGHELCEQLRKLSCFRQTPIVILTGSDGFANRLQANFAGASDFLPKPLDAEAVLNVIQKRLNQSSARNLSLATDR